MTRKKRGEASAVLTHRQLFRRGLFSGFGFGARGGEPVLRLRQGGDSMPLYPGMNRGDIKHVADQILRSAAKNAKSKR